MAHSPKQEILKLIKSLPDDITFEDALYHIYIKETVPNRIKELDDGSVHPISEQEAKERFK